MAVVYAYEHEQPKEWLQFDGTNAQEVVDYLENNGPAGSYLEVPISGDIVVLLYPQRTVYVALNAYVSGTGGEIVVLSEGTFDVTYTVVE